MRNIKNAWKVIIRIFVVLVFVFALESTIRYCYEGWYSTAMTRLSKLERKELKGTIDTVYCGSSVTYYAFNAPYLDEKLGTSSFNLATSSQPVFASYCLIRETAEQNPLKRVYQVITVPSLKKARVNKNYIAAYANFNTWKWRLRYLAELADEDLILTNLFYSTNVEMYSDLSAVKRNIAHKKDPYLDVDKYAGRGSRAGYTAVFNGEAGNVPNREKKTWYGELGTSQIDEKAMKYLKKTADFCEKNDIKYTLIVLPQPDVNLEIIGDIDAYDECLRGLSEELGADYYNFLLYKDREKVFTNDKFRDIEHMNDSGQKLFCDLLVDVLNSDRPEDYFYDSIEEFKQSGS